MLTAEVLSLGLKLLLNLQMLNIYSFLPTIFHCNEIIFHYSKMQLIDFSTLPQKKKHVIWQT